MLNFSHDIGKVNKDFANYAKALKQATASALNKTADQALTGASKQVRTDYNVKAGDLRDATKIKRATAGNAKAVIGIGGRRIRLVKFGARQTKKGVTVQVKKSNGRKVIAHAFINPLKSGGADTIYMRKGKDRYPLQSLLGPAPWQIFKGQEKLVFSIYDKKFPEILDHEIKFRTGKL